MKKILILGSTGSIGKNTLDVIQNNPNLFELSGIVCRRNIELLEEQIAQYKPKNIGIYDKNVVLNKKAHWYIGEDEIIKMVRSLDYDIVVIALVGASGLKPTLAAIESGKNVALATKEVMVMAGKLIQELIQKQNKKRKKINKPPIQIYPIDSELSAIWQSLESGNKDEIEKIILTCSGGPFKNTDINKFSSITPIQALRHPKWKMGKRISIDSATLMNKGFEVIETRWFFDIDLKKIEVVIHPQSILHSAVGFCDGSIVGQFAVPDMRIPIQYALSYPKRISNQYPRLSFIQEKILTFEKPDIIKFPCLSLAYRACKEDGTMPTVLNAADEIVVDLFLKSKIHFLDIPTLIEKVMDMHKIIKNPSLEDIVETDHWTRKKLLSII